MNPVADLTLKGQTVLLLGGGVEDSPEESLVDSDFGPFSDDESDVRIEEAVVSLARAVFARGGQLAVQDDPVVTPLVIEVAMEYWQSLPSEHRSDESENRRFSGVPVLIVQSDAAYDNHEEFGFATQIGCAKPTSRDDIKQVPFSRIVCIGGGRDVDEQLSRLAPLGQSATPVFAIPSTGGAAKSLANKKGVRNPEQEISQIIAIRRKQLHFKPPERESSDAEEPYRSRVSWEGQAFGEEHIQDFRYALYPIVMSVILDSEPEASVEERALVPQGS
jgi:hypothetical protein